jgi:adenylosuccinate synthase
VHIVFGLAWGDEAKGKITAELASKTKYDFVCRWNGGNNAGHTVYVDGKKLKTHLIPSGVFYNTKSIIGPNCVLHPESFYAEIKYLEENGFDTTLIKVSPKAHIIQEAHIEKDKNELAKKLGTTSRGIAPCYADKAARTGILAKDVLDPKYIWDEKLYGNILCEGAQGFWLDINQGDYPYVTSSETLPYSACSLGFPPQKITKIFGAAKAYDTRSGEDPNFPQLDEVCESLKQIADIGQEFGVTTGRRRKVNWLNLEKLIQAINISGTTDLIISKVDVLKAVEHLNEIKFLNHNKVYDVERFKFQISNEIHSQCPLIKKIIFSESAEKI